MSDTAQFQKDKPQQNQYKGFQSGVIAAANSDAIFITLNAERTDNALSQVSSVLASCPELETEFRRQYPEADLHITVAVGSHYWNLLSPEQRPAELVHFPEMSAEQSAPETPADLLFHIRSERHDLNYELASRVSALLSGVVSLVEEVHGFRYLDSRDLTGFVDGTENPEGEHRIDVAVVGDDDAVFAGGSYIHLQRYEHDLDAWNRIQVKQQEDIIGRTKADNIEYSSADKAAFSHTKRVSLKDAEGQSVEILRHSMPYGDLSRKGLLFASYGRSPEPFRSMLNSMIRGDEHGHADHLLGYSQAVTGQAFFAPSVDWLMALKS
ncbi:Dyp-type peroxidase [Amphritea balenae]|uniref:Dyp-type peroxidase n=1 Tax=Amphritea balenae TaxID=452629 RepID=A0A3P1SSA8_9GAMM|nr:Dyp-type peroxidase [Amphritea balenae]RRD00062.1 Dyp-type peroxidase [Amphritea balenae]GGK76216.1 peroxidase [Amphritea balenae]